MKRTDVAPFAFDGGYGLGLCVHSDPSCALYRGWDGAGARVLVAVYPAGHPVPPPIDSPSVLLMGAVGHLREGQAFACSAPLEGATVAERSVAWTMPSGGRFVLAVLAQVCRAFADDAVARRFRDLSPSQIWLFPTGAIALAGGDAAEAPAGAPGTPARTLIALLERLLPSGSGVLTAPQSGTVLLELRHAMAAAASLGDLEDAIAAAYVAQSGQPLTDLRAPLQDTSHGAPSPSSHARGVTTDLVAKAGPRAEPSPRYTPLRWLGAGGMGAVDVVFDHLRGEAVARKRLLTATPEHIVALKREFRTLEALDHPNLVRLHDLAEDGDGLFFTMELVAGGDWGARFGNGKAARVARTDAVTIDVTLGGGPRTHLAHGPPEGPPPSAPAENHGSGAPLLGAWVLQLVAALGYLHARGIAHCDLKPSNVLIDGDGSLKLADFGIATTLSTSPETARIMGTLGYIAPERFRGATPSPTGDLYALGVMLFEAVAGRPPFDFTSVAAILGGVVRPAPALVSLCPRVAAPIAAVIDGLLSADPAARPTLDAVAAAFTSPAEAATDGRAKTASSTMPPPFAHEPFVGRDAELGALRRHLDLARDGGCEVVVLTGETGMGKSKLLAAFLAEAEAGGARILRGGARVSELLAFNGLDEAIDELVKLLARPAYLDLGHALVKERTAAASVFPALLPQGTAFDPPAARPVAFAALAAVLRAVAEASKALILCLDDMQWMSQDAAVALETIVAAAPPKLLILGAARTDTAATALVRLQALRGVTRLDLAPLAASALHAVARAVLRDATGGEGGDMSPEALETLAALSGGRPMLVKLSVQALARGGTLQAPAEALAAAVASVSEETLALLRLLAAAEEPSPLSRLAEVLGRPYAEVERSARDLLREGLLRWARASSADREVDFYHDTLRTAVAEATEPDLLAAAHRALAAWWGASPTPSDVRRVRHLLRGGSQAEAQALAARAAETAMGARAYSLAADLFALAQDGSGADVVALLEARARALELSARFREAATCFAQLARVRTGAAAVDARLDEAYARLAANDVEAGRQSLREALGPSVVRPWDILLALLWILFGPLSRAPHRRGPPAPLPTDMTDAADREERVGALIAYFDPVVGIAYLRRMRLGFEAQGAYAHVASCEYLATYNALFLSSRIGRMGAASRLSRRAAAWEALARPHRPALDAVRIGVEGVFAQCTGDWDLALERLRRAAAIYEAEGQAGGFRHLIVLSHLVAVTVATRSFAEIKEATTHFAFAARQGSTGSVHCHLEVMRAMVERCEGRFEEAWARLDRLRSEWPDAPTFQRVYVFVAPGNVPITASADPSRDWTLARRALKEGARFRLLNTMYCALFSGSLAMMEAFAIARGEAQASMSRLRRLRRRALDAPPFLAARAICAEAYAARAVGSGASAVRALLEAAEARARATREPSTAAIAKALMGRWVGGVRGPAMVAEARQEIVALGMSPRLVEEDAGV